MTKEMKFKPTVYPTKRAVRLSPQASRETKKADGSLAARKGLISTTSHQWWMKVTPHL